MRVRTLCVPHSFFGAKTILSSYSNMIHKLRTIRGSNPSYDSFILVRQYDTSLLLQYDTQTTHGPWNEIVSDSFILSCILLRPYDNFILLQYDTQTTHSLWIELVSDSFILLTPSFSYANMILPCYSNMIHKLTFITWTSFSYAIMILSFYSNMMHKLHTVCVSKSSLTPSFSYANMILSSFSNMIRKLRTVCGSNLSPTPSFS